MAQPDYLICQKWEESERCQVTQPDGSLRKEFWGVRPDGYSLHLSTGDLVTYIANNAPKWMLGDEIPDEYSRPSGTPYRCKVVISGEQLAMLDGSPGLRFHDNNYPAAIGGSKDRWVAVGEKIHRTLELETVLHMGLGAVGPLKEVTPLLRERFALFVDAAYKVLAVEKPVVHTVKKNLTSNPWQCPLWAYYDVPGHWPKGHGFSDERKDVNCPSCLETLEAADAELSSL